MPLDAPEPSDDALIREGTVAAFETLARRYRGRVYAFSLTLLRRPEDAEDVTQETFVRAFRTLPFYQPRGRFRAWLFKIAANLCRDRRRNEARHAAAAAVAAAEPVAPSNEPADLVALRTAVREAIGRLPEGYRAPVVLYYLEQLAVAEVAAVLGRSPSAVKVQLWRARGLLAAELADWLD